MEIAILPEAGNRCPRAKHPMFVMTAETRIDVPFEDHLKSFKALSKHGQRNVHNSIHHHKV